MTADAVSGAAKPLLSPRKQRQSKPLTDSFLGAASGLDDISGTPSVGRAGPASSQLLSSSPAFATPMHPIRPFNPRAVSAAAGGTGAGSGAGSGAGLGGLGSGAAAAAGKPTILPIQLPPATLRPLAFRTFTKKHSLTLTASALQEMATFIGRHCGSGWREEGLAERVLEETAKGWKNRNCGFIVDGASPELKEILKTLESNMSGGRIVQGGARGAAAGMGMGFGVGAAVAIRGSSGLAGREGRRGGGAAPGLGSVGRQDSLLLKGAQESEITNTQLGLRPATLARGRGAGSGLVPREDSQIGTGSMAEEGMDVDDMDAGMDSDADGAEGDGDGKNGGLADPRRWMKVVGAFDQPRMVYNVAKKHFERDSSKPSILPNISHKTAVFRNRFNVIHQRLLRNETFQSSAVAEARLLSGAPGAQTQHKITPVANLLGRHGTHHMLLGMLVVLPTGRLSICDMSASIVLDLSSAVAVPEDSAWFVPGMIVLADGVYEEDEEEAAGRGLNGATGVGGTIGGRFQAFFIGQPPSEKRRVSLGISGPDGGGGGHGEDHTIGGGFGWIDFLGVGSQRAVGARMRRLEQRLTARRLRQRQHLQRQLLEQGGRDKDADMETQRPAAAAAAERTVHAGRQRAVVLGELNLDQPRTLQALRKVLALYDAEPAGSTPLVFVLTGNFTEHAVLAHGGSSGGSIEYKEYFDALAAALADHPNLLQQATFVFVPGDNDAWVSSFAGGAAVPLPRRPVPDLFTSRVRRVFATAQAEQQPAGDKEGGAGGGAIWTTNPSRLSLFGPSHEIVLFRDDMASRLRRTAIRLATASSGQQEGQEGQDDQEGQKRESQENQDIPHDVRTARKLVKTVLDQGFLAPFRQNIRPVHWDFAGALQLYPLPTAMVLMDTTAPPYCVTYEGCHVMNPGSLLVPGRRGTARWIEYDIGGMGRMRECMF